MPVCQPLDLLHVPLPKRSQHVWRICDRWTARCPDVSYSVSLEPRKARRADLNEPKTREAATKAGEPRLKEL